MKNTTEIQRYLIGKGFLAEGGDDGTFGQLTLDAYNLDRAARGKPPVVLGQFSLTSINADLFPDEQPAPPPPKPPGTFDLIKLAYSFFNRRNTSMRAWFTTFVGTTAFKYLVAMASSQIANWLGFDPIEGKATIEGVLMQLIGFGMMAWGMWESTRNKIVMDGVKVVGSDLTKADKATVTAIVTKTDKATEAAK